jgi:hypothetical protein
MRRARRRRRDRFGMEGMEGMDGMDTEGGLGIEGTRPRSVVARLASTPVTRRRLARSHRCRRRRRRMAAFGPPNRPVRLRPPGRRSRMGLGAQSRAVWIEGRAMMPPQRVLVGA